jgi:uncharacterized protein (TIGR03437 family)
MKILPSRTRFLCNLALMIALLSLMLFTSSHKLLSFQSIEAAGVAATPLPQDMNHDSRMTRRLNLLSAPSSSATSTQILTQQELARQSSRNPAGQTVAELITKAQAEGAVRVIVGLRIAFEPEGRLASLAQVLAQRLAIAQSQNTLLSQMAAYRVTSVKQFAYIPFLAMEVDAAGLEYLQASPGVVSIQEDTLHPLSLAESVPLIGAPAAWASGYTGVGQTVAILDSGVDKTHPFLAGKIVSEACYSTSNSTTTSVCPGGVAQSTATGAGVNCTAAGCDHGTHVAGIAAGKSATFSGVAKEANVIAIQVFSRLNTCPPAPNPCIGAYTSDIILGLQRVQTLNSSFNIAAVNLSLGSGAFASNCDAAEAASKAAIDSLRSLGIATVVAAGNDGSATNISAPACISTAISVGSTGDGSGGATQNVISSFSNNASFLNLLAPGAIINSSVPGGGFANFVGTSMAAPHVAGAWAVLKSKSPNASVSQILSALTSTGLPVTDTRNSIVKPRVKVDAAANALSSNSCSLTLSSNSQSFTAAASTGTVNVTAGAGCDWTASSNNSWISVTSGGSGSGNGTVNYSVAANTGAARTGTMFIAGQTFMVTQAVNPQTVTLAVDDGSIEDAIGLIFGGTLTGVNRLTPPSYPATLNSVSIFLPGGAGISPGQSLTILAGANPSGSSNINAISLQPTPATIQTLNQFNVFTVPSITITSGDFVVGMRITHAANAFPFALDESLPRQRRSYISPTGSTFTLIDDEGLPGNFMIRALVTQVPVVNIVAAGTAITTENCSPANGVIDAGEMVTVDFSLKNTGNLSTTNLTATLQATGGVTGPSGPQSYGVLAAGGPAVTKAFTFTADPALTCGSTLSATLRLQDGTADLGTITFTFTLGTRVPLSENFDGVTAPTLPAGWASTVAAGSAPAWVTSTTSSDTPPNNAFATDPGSVSDVRLDSPTIAITTASAQLTFRNNYLTETEFDGGVLEIAIGAGAFTDIIAAGGSFVTGGYTQTLIGSNPIAGRQAWSGNSGGYITTTINLPAAAAGQNIKLRWRMTSDASVSGTGWRIDSIKLTDGTACATNCGGPFCPVITITPASLPTGTIGAVYNQTLTASGGAAPHSFMLSAGTLPNGLTLSSGGALSGTPTQSGSFNLTVKATDANGCTGTRAYTLVISCPAITVNPTTLPAGTTGTAYTQTLTASGGAAPHSFMLSAGTLPNGLTLSSGGALSGTPTQSGGFNITVRATDATGCTGTRAYTLVINCPAITINPATLPAGTTGTAYTQTLTASGGTPPFGFAVTAGALPGGLTLSAAGVLSGTPNAAGTFNFTVTATDANSCTGTRGYTVSIASPPPPQMRALYALNDCRGCGNQIFGFAVNETTGALTPLPGFPINTSGNGDGLTASERLTIDRANQRLYAINSGTNNVSAYAINPATGALTPLPFSPIGLDGGNWNTIAVHPSGSPLVIGDSNSPGKLLSYQITATAATAATGNPFATGSASPFSTTFSQTGSYIYTGGNINSTIAGFNVNPATGNLTALLGSPFDSGNLFAAAYATDAAGRLFIGNDTVVRAFTTTNGILSAVSGNPFPSGLLSTDHGLTHPNGFYLVADRIGNQVGVYRIQGSGSATTLAAVAGSPFASGGSFTDVLALNQAGTFLFAANGLSRNLTTFGVNSTTGALTQLGTQFINTLGDSGIVTGLAYFAPSCPTITLSPATLPNGTAGTAYNQTISASPAGSYTFAVTAGALPAGLSLNSTTGALTGTPTAAGTSNFTITATGSGGCTGSQAYTLNIQMACPSVTGINPTSGIVGSQVTITGANLTGVTAVRFTNGVTAAFTVVNDTTITATVPNGAITGAITVSKTGCPDIQTGNFTVTCPTITINPATLPAGTLNAAYNQTLTASGGIAPHTFTLSAGALPSGLTLSAAGALTGTPTQRGTFNFTVKATDVNGCMGTRAYSLVINCPAITLAPATLPSGTVNTAYNQTISASPAGTYTFAVTAGALPAGLSLNSTTGALTGTPTAAGTSNFTITATGSGDCIGSQAYVLTINPAPNTPRPARAVSASAAPGSSVGIPIELDAQGNENALGFSLIFDPAILSNPLAALGADTAGATLNVNPSQAAQGRLGILLSLPAGQSFAAGTRRMATVSFTVAPGAASTATPLAFGDQPVARELVDLHANTLPVSFTPGAITILAAQGFEADVAPRPNGSNNGMITAADWTLTGRFAAGLETATPGSEFQRADSAPRESLGNGQITIADWVQAGRYAAGLDPVTAMGGPASFGSAAQAFASRRAASAATAAPGHAAEALPRLVRAIIGQFERGQPDTVIIELDAQGEENALGLSLHFDPTQLRFVSASAGRDAGRASLQVNPNQAGIGRVGLTLALPPGETLTAGRRQLLILTFAPVASDLASAPALGFGDGPVARELVDAQANNLRAAYALESATVNTRALVSVSAASFLGPELASEAIAAAFGTGLATITQPAETTPLPEMLAGTTVRVRDSAGVERIAALFFVSPAQVNYQIPPGTALGTATVSITAGDGTVSRGLIQISAVAPSLFAANANGQGVAAAVAVRVRADGGQSFEPVAEFDPAQGRFIARPLDLGAEGESVYLALFGTGLRHRRALANVTMSIGGVSAEVEYAGPQPDFAGLDQINVRLPRGLIGRGEVDIVLAVDGHTANTVKLHIR